jgi:hypothetical protein
VAPEQYVVATPKGKRSPDDEEIASQRALAMTGDIQVRDYTNEWPAVSGMWQGLTKQVSAVADCQVAGLQGLSSHIRPTLRYNFARSLPLLMSASGAIPLGGTVH